MRRTWTSVRDRLTGPRESFGEHCKSGTVQQKWYIILFNLKMKATRWIEENSP